MDQQPPKKSNKTLFIVLGAIAVVGFISLLCCGVAGYFTYQAVDDMDFTYYAECENAPSDTACSQCCEEMGHNGQAYGSFFHDDGKTCGCI